MYNPIVYSQCKSNNASREGSTREGPPNNAIRRGGRKAKNNTKRKGEGLAARSTFKPSAHDFPMEERVGF